MRFPLLHFFFFGLGPRTAILSWSFTILPLELIFACSLKCISPIQAAITTCNHASSKEVCSLLTWSFHFHSSIRYFFNAIKEWWLRNSKAFERFQCFGSYFTTKSSSHNFPSYELSWFVLFYFCKLSDKADGLFFALSFEGNWVFLLL